MMAAMDWGIHLPHLGRQATRTARIEFSQQAEQLGFHSGWVSDHVAWPGTIASEYPYTDDGSFAPPTDMPWLDPIGTMFFVAGCTETLKLAPTVLILGYRPPGVRGSGRRRVLSVRTGPIRPHPADTSGSTGPRGRAARARRGARARPVRVAPR